jgi:outer membrane protein TolC
MTRLAVLFLLGAAACLAQVADRAGQPPILTLDEATKTALKENVQVQTSLLDVFKAQQATAELGAKRLPQFDAEMLSGIALNQMHFIIPEGAIGNVPGIGPLPAKNDDVSVARHVTALVHGSAVQPLSQLYKIGLGMHESRIGEALAQENLRLKRQQTVEQVRGAYGELVETQAQLDAAESSLRALTELEQLTERRLAEEAVLKSDLLTVKANAGKARYQVMVLRDAMQTRKEAFNRLLGRDIRIEFSVETLPALSPEELDLDAARKKALEQRPEIRQAALQMEKAELDVRRERAEYVPDLSVQLSYLSFANVNFAPQNLTSAGLLFEWDPFDWGQKHHKIGQLKSIARQAALANTDAGQQVLIDVDAQYRRLEEARALVDAQTAARDAEQERLRVVMDRFAVKAVLTADVLEQQAALEEADSNLAQAISELWKAEAAFHRALGEE